MKRQVPREPASRRGRRMPLSTRLLMLGLASLVCWTVLGFVVQFARTYALAREAAGLESRRRNLLTENAAILAEIQRLRTDDQYLERLAREKLGMLRPGEIELVIVPAPAPRHVPVERDGRSVTPERPEPRGKTMADVLRETARDVRDRLLDVLQTLARTVRPRP